MIVYTKLMNVTQISIIFLIFTYIVTIYVTRPIPILILSTLMLTSLMTHYPLPTSSSRNLSYSIAILEVRTVTLPRLTTTLISLG